MTAFPTSDGASGTPPVPARAGRPAFPPGRTATLGSAAARTGPLPGRRAQSPAGAVRPRRSRPRQASPVPTRSGAGELDPGLAPGCARADGTGPSSRPDRARREPVAGIQPDDPAALGRNTAAGAEGHPELSLPDRAAGTGRDGQGGKSGAEWRKAAKAVLSAQARARRARATTYTPKSQRTVGSQYRPGMGVRRPQEPREGEGG